MDIDQKLYQAARRGSIYDIDLFIHQGATDINNALYGAVEFGFLNIVKHLVEHGADLQHKNNDLLKYAAKLGYAHIVEYIQHQHPLTHSLNVELFYIAVNNGRHHVIIYLITNNLIDAYHDNHYALKESSKLGSIKIVDYLLKHKYSNSSDSQEALENALCNALLNKHMHIVVLLQSYVNILNK